MQRKELAYCQDARKPMSQYPQDNRRGDEPREWSLLCQLYQNSQKEEHARHINNFQRNSEAHNRMKALLTLKAKMNSIDDIFKFAHDKLGLKTVRPDAKLLSANIDKQIARAFIDTFKTILLFDLLVVY